MGNCDSYGRHGFGVSSPSDSVDRKDNKRSGEAAIPMLGCDRSCDVTRNI